MPLSYADSKGHIGNTVRLTRALQLSGFSSVSFAVSSSGLEWYHFKKRILTSLWYNKELKRFLLGGTIGIWINIHLNWRTKFIFIIQNILFKCISHTSVEQYFWPPYLIWYSVHLFRTTVSEKGSWLNVDYSLFEPVFFFSVVMNEFVNMIPRGYKVVLTVRHPVWFERIPLLHLWLIQACFSQTGRHYNCSSIHKTGANYCKHSVNIFYIRCLSSGSPNWLAQSGLSGQPRTRSIDCWAKVAYKKHCWKYKSNWNKGKDNLSFSIWSLWSAVELFT